MDKDDYPYEYQWSAQNGSKLLAKGVCVEKGYQKHFVPEKGITKVHSTIEYQRIRAVSSKEQTVTMDFTLTLKWMDPHIRTTEEELATEGILLSPAAIKMIWTPDLHIWNRTSSQTDERILMISSKILSSDERNKLEAINEAKDKHSRTGIEMSYEIKTTVFCDFKHSAYPMDEQRCDITFGSSSSGAIFVLNETHRKQDPTNTYQAANFDVSISFSDGKTGQRNNNVGIMIEMKRVTTAFILKYYIPCMAIVLVSVIGFVIPASAIPGRVALLVTQFLTLINLFICQMVSKYKYLCL